MSVGERTAHLSRSLIATSIIHPASAGFAAGDPGARCLLSRAQFFVGFLSVVFCRVCVGSVRVSFFSGKREVEGLACVWASGKKFMFERV